MLSSAFRSLLTKSSLLFLFLLGGKGVHGQEETAEEFQDRIRMKIQRIFNQQQEAYAMWIGLSDPEYGDMYFVFGNSTSTEEGSSPPDVAATLDDVFQIGSISKTFLGTAMLLLESRGDLSLNDTVQELVPDFALEFPQYANYTVENLLRMETLVPDFLNDEEGILNDYSKNISKRYSVEEIVAYAMQRYPSETPGYSNTNFVVGEFIVEAVTGQKIEKVIEDLVFGPLGLENMELPNRFSDGVLPDPAATPYLGPSCLEGLSIVGLDGSFEVNQDISEFANGVVMAGIGGAINSNIYDLLAWAKSGTGDDLLTEEMVQRRHEMHPLLAANYSIPYGIALAEVQLGGSWYGHDGATFGYSAEAWRHGSSGASFAGALNTCGSAIIVLVRVWVMFVEELLDRDLAVTLEPSMTVAPSMTPAPSSTSEVSPTASPGTSPTNPATSPTGPPLMEAPTSSAQNVMKAMWSSLVILGSLVLHLF